MEIQSRLDFFAGPCKYNGATVSNTVALAPPCTTVQTTVGARITVFQTAAIADGSRGLHFSETGYLREIAVTAAQRTNFI